MIINMINSLNYDISIELSFFVVDLILVFFMLITKPRKTYDYIYDFVGAIASLFAAALMMIIGYMASKANEFEIGVIKMQMVEFICFYSVILGTIFLYICFLSIKMRKYSEKILILTISFLFVVDIFCSYKIITHTMLIGLDKTVDTTFFLHMVCSLGLMCGFVCIAMGVILRNNLSRVVKAGVYFFVPIDIALLMWQYNVNDTYFVSSTFVLPIFIFYLLFHSAPFDEITGCQSAYSFENKFNNEAMLGRKFYVAYLVIPILNKINDKEYEDLITNVISKMYRKIEKVDSHIYIYNQARGSFSFIFDCKNVKVGQKRMLECFDIIKQSIETSEYEIKYKMIAFACDDNIKTIYKMRAYMSFLMDKRTNDNESINYLAGEKDYNEFEKNYNIKNELLNIKEEKNYDDARVICMAQPIYNVKTGTFRTAEALMRLKINDEMISPMIFIPIAQRIDVIHTLTMIMLNKVCNKIKNMEEKFDFDAISINVSASEMCDMRFSDEVISVIKKYDIVPSKICLEVTESVTELNESVFTENMNKLQDYGIRFYLDDFGCGYSSLERLLKYKFDVIKFDKMLLNKAMQDKDARDVVVTIHNFLKSKNCITLIEGVESGEEEMLCIEQKFDYIQGFRYARAQNVSNLDMYFSKTDTLKKEGM